MICVWKAGHHIQIQIMMQNPSQEPPASSKDPNQDSKVLMFFAPSKSKERARIWNMGEQKTSDNIQMKIKMPNPRQEPPVSSNAQNED